MNHRKPRSRPRRSKRCGLCGVIPHKIAAVGLVTDNLTGEKHRYHLCPMCAAKMRPGAITFAMIQIVERRLGLAPLPGDPM